MKKLILALIVLAFSTTAGSAASMTVDASGFNGNLATTDDTLQEVAQKLDDLVASGAALSGLTDNRLIRANGTDNVQNSGYTIDDDDLITPPSKSNPYLWLNAATTDFFLGAKDSTSTLQLRHSATVDASLICTWDMTGNTLHPASTYINFGTTVGTSGYSGTASWQ